MKRYFWCCASVAMLAMTVAAGCAHLRKGCDSCSDGCGETCSGECCGESTGTTYRQTVSTDEYDRAKPLAAAPAESVTR